MFCWTYLKVRRTSWVPRRRVEVLIAHLLGHLHITGNSSRGKLSARTSSDRHLTGLRNQSIPRSDPPPALDSQLADRSMSGHTSQAHLYEDSEDYVVSAGPLDGGRNLLPAEFSLPAFMESSQDRSQGLSVPTRSRQSLGMDPYGRPADYAMTGDPAGSLGTRASSHFGNEMNLVGSRESAFHLTGHHDPRQCLPPSRVDSQAEPTVSAHSEQPITPSRPFPTEQKVQAYCPYCQIYKPWRSHHCRVCGVCVLGME